MADLPRYEVFIEVLSGVCLLEVMLELLIIIYNFLPFSLYEICNHSVSEFQ
jgi:hypothetical protein